jgi:mxaJ protein
MRSHAPRTPYEIARWAAGLISAFALAAPAVRAAELRVCADPNNLPFSNELRQGMENKLVERLAQRMGRDVVYTWRAQRRGFLRETLKAGACDVVPGFPEGMEGVATTKAYYRSAYAFVTRAGEPVLRSLDDEALKRLRIGVQIIGDDGWSTPPAHALARRGMVNNVRGYSVLGDYRESDPPARIIDAVRSGSIDVAIAWGPMAGYFASRADPRLVVTPLRDSEPNLPLRWSIAMAVRKEDTALRDALDEALVAERPYVVALLAAFAVPLVELPTGEADADHQPAIRHRALPEP